MSPNIASQNGNTAHNKQVIKGCPERSVTETLSNGFFTVDKDWKVIYWNKAAETLLGITAEKITGKNLWDCFADKLPVEFYAVYQKAFLKNSPLHFEEYWGEMGCWFNVITYYSDNRLSVSFKTGGNPLDVYAENSVERLKTLTELYRFVTEITNDCLWEWNVVNGEIFWIDGGHKRVFGYKVENALIPQSFWESCIHPDDRGRVLLKLSGIMANAESSVWEDEYRFLHVNGKYIHVHDRGHIIYSNGIASRIIGATQDISQRVELQNKLQEKRVTRQREINKAMLQAQETERAKLGNELQENLAQLLAVINMYLGMARQQKGGDEFVKKASIHLKDAIKGVASMYKNLMPPDLTYLTVFEKIKEITSELSAAHSIKFAVTENNFEEIKKDEKLQVNIYRIVQDHLKNIVTHAVASNVNINISCYKTAVVIVISDDGKGFNLDKVKFGAGMNSIKARAELYRGNITVLAKPGQGCTLKVMLYFDAQLQRRPFLQEQIIHLVPPGTIQKIPADFALALCHEVKNPLTNIMLSLEMLKPKIAGEEEKNFVEIISRSATRINGLLTDLLSNYKGDETTLQPKQANQLLDEVIEMTNDRFVLKNIKVEKRYNTEDCKILINIPQIKIALINIVTNALEAMAPGKGILQLVTKTVNSQCIIEIGDNGSGISKENLKNIFKPYFSDKQGGMGLGLSTTMAAFLANHVKVEVLSDVGKGTRFILLFKQEYKIEKQEKYLQNKGLKKLSAQITSTNETAYFQNGEKEEWAEELLTANKELAFQNVEKEERAEELSTANKELAFQNVEKEERAAELLIANKELVFQNGEKEKRAAELLIANKELAFQNGEKEKRASELIVANAELVFQNAEKEKMAADFAKMLREKNAILESIADAFFAVDKNWIITYWNHAAEVMMEKPKELVLGFSLWDIYPEIVDSVFSKKYHQALQTGKVIHFEEYSLFTLKWYEISVYPSEDGLSIYLKDVTVRKNSELVLNNLNEILEIKGKHLVRSNDELERFTYVASHDLMEPLRMVTSFLTLFKDKYTSLVDEEGKAYIEFAVNGAVRMKQLISDLLEFSRLNGTNERLNLVDLKKLIDDTLIFLSVLIEEKKAVITFDELPGLQVPEVPLRQVFQNLISNALKYMRKDIAALIKITAEELPGHWLFTVADNGIGIREDFFDRIFVIFQRLHNKDEYSGTGMGLAITKKIVENMGGTIWLTSQEGAGSTFYFTIAKVAAD